MTPALYGFIAGGILYGAAVLAAFALADTVLPALPKIRRALAGVPQGRGRP